MSQSDPLPTADCPATSHAATDQDVASQYVTKGIDRRTVIRNAGVVGVGVVGAATLAACGGGKEAAPTVSPSSAAAGAAKNAIKETDIPVGGGKVFDAAKVVVTQPKAGEFKAFSAICTHQGCTVATVANGTINCPCHGSKYDIATGAVKGGPAPQPLASKAVKVSDGSITVT